MYDLIITFKKMSNIYQLKSNLAFELEHTYKNKTTRSTIIIGQFDMYGLFDSLSGFRIQDYTEYIDPMTMETIEIEKISERITVLFDDIYSVQIIESIIYMEVRTINKGYLNIIVIPKNKEHLYILYDTLRQNQQ